MQTVGLSVILGADFSSAEEAMAKFRQSVNNLASETSKAFANMAGTAQNIGNAFKPVADGARNATQVVINESKARVQADNEETSAALNASKLKIQALREQQAAQRAATQAKKAEKDLYAQEVAAQNEIVRAYYNAAIALRKYGEASGFTAQQIEEMAIKAREGQEMLKQIEAGAGRFQRNVGNYSGATQYLSQSIAQLSGEIPNFFQSMRIGFMSIGNNIQPISQAIKGLRAENAQLLAQGKQTVPILSTVIKSFLGWQTILLVGVGIISRYGAQLVDWASNAIKGKTAIDQLRDSIKKSNDEFNSGEQITKRYVDAIKSIDSAKTEANKSAGEEIAKLQALYTTMTSTNNAMSVRKNAYDKIIALYPQLNGFITEEKALSGGLAATINKDLIPAILKRAAVEGLQSAIVAAYKEKADLIANEVLLTNRAAESYKNAASAQKGLDSAIKNAGRNGFGGVISSWIDRYSAIGKDNSVKGALAQNATALQDINSRIPVLATEMSKAIKDFSGSILGTISPAQQLEDRLKALNAVAKTQKEGTAEYNKTKNEIQSVSDKLKAYNDSSINAKTHTDALTKSQNNLNAEFTQTARKLDAGVITAFQAMKENISTVSQHLDKLFKNGGTQDAIQKDIELLKQMNYQLSQMRAVDLNALKGVGGQSASDRFGKDLHEATKGNQDRAAAFGNNIFSGINLDKQQKRWTEEQREFNREWNHTYSIVNKLVGGPLDGFVNAIFKGDNAIDALGNGIKDIVTNLAAAVVKAGIFSAIMSAINPVGFAAGGGFLGILGKLLPFASGGIVTGPTPALVGEAGPEAIIPLNKLGSIMNNRDLNVRISGRLRGMDINVANEKAQAFKTR